MISAGIDMGSRTVKVVLLDAARGHVLSTAIADQGVEQSRLAQSQFDRALAEATLDRGAIGAVVATGYGRQAVSFADTTITEITCHARGVRHLVPDVRTIIEIGGQDSKVIWLEERGQVRDFAMNDRCAAGTGRFLEVVAARLEVEPGRLSELARCSGQPALISSTCVVFAETEIIGLLAGGSAVSDIAAGVQNAVASRVASLVGRSIAPPVIFTGGVALQEGMTQALSQALNCPLRLSPMPQYTGALGAALLAADLRKP